MNGTQGPQGDPGLQGLPGLGISRSIKVVDGDGQELSDIVTMVVDANGLYNLARLIDGRIWWFRDNGTVISEGTILGFSPRMATYFLDSRCTLPFVSRGDRLPAWRVKFAASRYWVQSDTADLSLQNTDYWLDSGGSGCSYAGKASGDYFSFTEVRPPAGVAFSIVPRG